MSWFKTVLIVVEGGGPTGGAERVAFDTVELLSSAGFQVHILSSATQIDQSYLDLPGVTGESLGLPAIWDTYFSKNRLASLPLSFGDKHLGQLLEKSFTNFDPATTLVHIHGFHSAFSHLVIKASLDRAFATHLHAHDYGISCPNTTLFNYPENAICRVEPLSSECWSCRCMGEAGNNIKKLRFKRAFATNKIDRIPDRLTSILCPSPFSRAVLTRFLGDLPKLRVLRCPVHPASTTQSRPQDSNTFLWIGRLTAEKNPDIACAAASAAGIALTIVGDGPLKLGLQQQFPEHRFVGWKSPEEVSKLQSSARCLVMSSAWYETASLVVLECLAAGVPCVIGEESAATSWITPEHNGLTFLNGQVQSLQFQLERLKIDDLVRQLGENAFARYWQAPSSTQAYFDALIEVYDLR